MDSREPLSGAHRAPLPGDSRAPSWRHAMSYRILLLPALLGLLAIPEGADAQGFNGRARTYASAFKIRDLVLDSVPAAGVPGEGVQRFLPDGTPVTCSATSCQYFRSGEELGVIPILQDLEVNVWTGVTGLRAYAHVRGRQSVGDWRVVWPRMEEELEALAAYVEYGRSFYRVQAGRIWQTSSLGLYNYDGASAFLRLPRRVDLNVYGGLSLARGLNQLYSTDLISSVEPLGPREDAWLGGFVARWRPIPALAASLTYQREWTTHSGDLYSDRLAGSARLVLDQATVDAELKYDLAGDVVNLGRLGVTVPLGSGFTGRGEVRRYVPFFELWTIWGAFSPVGFDEARLRVDWMSPTGRISAHASGGYQKYGDTGAEPSEGYGIRDDAWRLGFGGRINLLKELTLNGEYRYQEGYGSSRHGGDAAAQWTFGRRLYLAATATAFETFSEFQIGSGRVFGAGAQGAAPVGPATLQGGIMFYKHDYIGRPSILDLNQTRGHLSLEIPFGKDPGLNGRANR